MTLRISDLQSDSNLDSIRNSCYVLCHSFSFAAFFVVVPENRIIRVQLVEAKLLWLKRYRYTICFFNLSSDQFIWTNPKNITFPLEKSDFPNFNQKLFRQPANKINTVCCTVTSQQTKLIKIHYKVLEKDKHIFSFKKRAPQSEVRFVTAVTVGGSVNFLPPVLISPFSLINFRCFYHQNCWNSVKLRV